MAVVGAVRAFITTQIIARALAGPAGWALLAGAAVAAGAAVWGVNKAIDASIAKSQQRASAYQKANAGGGVGGSRGLAPVHVAISDPNADKLRNDQYALLAELRDQRDELGLTGDALTLYRLSLLNVDDATMAYARHQADLNAQAQLAQSANELTQRLQDQAATLGMTAEQADLYHLAMQGATDAQLAGAKAAAATLAAVQKQHDLMERGKQVFEETRTPLEKYAQKLQELKDLYASGALGAGAAALDTFNRAKAQLAASSGLLGPAGPSAFSLARIGEETRRTSFAVPFQAKSQASDVDREILSIQKQQLVQQQQQTVILRNYTNNGTPGGGTLSVVTIPG
jgi:hypothetical protein